MGNQAGSVEVEWDIALVHPLVHLGDDVGVDGVIAPVTFATGKIGVDDVFVGRQVVVKYDAVCLPIFGSDLMARAVAAGERRADEFVLWVVVGRQWIVAGVHVGKALGALAIFALSRVCQPKEVDVQIAFAVVHPVVVFGELTVDLAVLGPLPGDAVPDVPGLIVEPIIATEYVQQGKLHEALVGIITAIHTGPLVAPNQSTVRAYIAGNKLAGSVVERINQLALLDGPAGDGHRGMNAISRVAHVSLRCDVVASIITGVY